MTSTRINFIIALAFLPALRSEHPLGRELGSVAQAKRPFLVRNIQLSVRSNHIPGCVASINIYRIEGKKESFVNVLHKPIYFDIAASDSPQDFDIRPDEAILMEHFPVNIGVAVKGMEMLE